MRPKRIAYAALGFAAVALALGVVISQHASWLPLAIFAIAPDITLLLGMSPGLERGQLHSRAVPFYNALHRLPGPIVLTVLEVLIRDPSWIAAGLAWIAHIAIDRSLGFGPRTPEGFQREDV